MKYTIKNIIKNNSKKFKNQDYIFEKKDGKYQPHSYNEFCQDVLKVAALLQKTHKKDDRIVICANNSYKYMVVDAAIMGYTCISVTVSKEWSCYDLANTIRIIEPKTIIYSRDKEKDINELKIQYPNINYIIIENMIPSELEKLDENRIQLRDACKIVFSSGTTGLPKGVVLSQENIFDSFDNVLKRAPFDDTDVDYLFLPLNHTYGGIWNFLLSVYTGMKLYLCSDTKLMFQEIQEVKPTIFCAVPLIFERLYETSIKNNLEPLMLLGGNVKYIFCGGAYHKPEIRKYLKEHGLNILEAYGLTETSSLISLEYSNKTDYESVGTILENSNVIIDNPNEDGIGEILVKGNNVFIKYYNNEYETNKAKDEKGFFHTGDLGYIIDNNLYLKGRKKRVIIFPNGENVYPDNIELLFDDDNISKVKVFDKNGIIFATIYVKEKQDYKEYINSINKKLPKFSQIQDYEVLIDNIAVRLK